MPASCLLPAGVGPAPADPRGAGGSAGPIVPGSFQVWLCLSVMSACLTGSQPSSGVHDGTGVLKQAGAGLGDGQDMGKKLSAGAGQRGWGEAGGKAYVWNWLLETQARQEERPPKQQAGPHLAFYLNSNSVQYQ